eukprot:Nk52_evm29s292 gene=Nk52_evmTU29s292
MSDSQDRGSSSTSSKGGDKGASIYAKLRAACRSAGSNDKSSKRGQGRVTSSAVMEEEGSLDSKSIPNSTTAPAFLSGANVERECETVKNEDFVVLHPDEEEAELTYDEILNLYHQLGKKIDVFEKKTFSEELKRIESEKATEVAVKTLEKEQMEWKAQEIEFQNKLVSKSKEHVSDGLVVGLDSHGMISKKDHAAVIARFKEDIEKWRAQCLKVEASLEEVKKNCDIEQISLSESESSFVTAKRVLTGCRKDFAKEKEVVEEMRSSNVVLDKEIKEMQVRIYEGDETLKVLRKTLAEKQQKYEAIERDNQQKLSEAQPKAQSIQTRVSQLKHDLERERRKGAKLKKNASLSIKEEPTESSKPKPIFYDSEIEEVSPKRARVDSIEPDDGDKECVVDESRSKGEPSHGLIHVRHDCSKYKFHVVYRELTGSTVEMRLRANAQYCPKCYCYVCEIPASQCIYWAGFNGVKVETELIALTYHCFAHPENLVWRSKKEAVRHAKKGT